jgi:hypothetical protein
MGPEDASPTFSAMIGHTAHFVHWCTLSALVVSKSNGYQGSGTGVL